MSAQRDGLDVRALDALGTPYGYDRDPRGVVRLRSQPGEWIKHPGSPVIEPGPEGTWDDAVISEAKVVYDGRLYHAWYAGRKRGPQGLKMPMDLGYATSPDGVHWQKSEANPVLVRGPIGGYDENMITAPHVLYDGERSTMWYSAVDFRGNWSINVATSDDGVHWRKDADNPLLEETHDDRWDAVYLAEPNVIYDGSRFRMWYNGASANTETLLGYAASPDGVHWTRFEGNRPVLEPGPDGAWDDFAVARGCVLYDGEVFKLWYEGHDGHTWRIGYATSPDGVGWTKSADNPVVDLGPESAWDSRVVSEPYVLFDGQTYRLWYSGYDGERFRTGLATAPAVYETRGVLTSAPFSSTRPIEWGTLTVDLALPESTGVQVEVSVGGDGETWGEWKSDPGEVSDGINDIDLTGLDLQPGRFLRYRATLTTADPSVSPSIHEVSVAEARPDFDLAVSQAGASSAAEILLQAGQEVELALAVEPRRGLTAAVEWAVQGLPGGVSLATEPRPLTPPETLSVVLQADARVQAGTIPVTVVATSGDLVHRAGLSLRLVAAPPATPTLPATPTPVATSTLASTAATPVPSPAISSPASPALPVLSASPAVFWPGIGLAAASALLLLAWSLTLWLTRSRAAEGEGGVSNRAWFRHWAWALFLGLLVLLGLFWSWRYVEARRAQWEAYQERVRPGVRISGLAATGTPESESSQDIEIAAGGLTEDEARQVLEAHLVAPLRRTLTVRVLDRTVALDTTDLGLETNLDEVVAQAMAAGAGQSTPDEFRRFLLQDPEPVDMLLTFTYTYNYDLIVPWIEELAADVEQLAVEHAFDERTLTFTRGQAGVRLDVEGAQRRLRAAVDDLRVAEVELPVVQVPPRDWSDDELRVTLSRAAAEWQAAPQPASSQAVTLTFDAERWIGPGAPAASWEPTRTMTATLYLPGRLGWTLDVTAAQQMLREAMAGEAAQAVTRVFTEVAPAPPALTDLKSHLLEIAGRFDGLTGFYVMDLASGQEIRHNTYVTASGMSMIKVAIMVTAYRSIPRPFDEALRDALSGMVAHSVNENSNAVILAIGGNDFQAGLERVNETLSALGMDQSYIRAEFRTDADLEYEPIEVPERPPVAVPLEEQIDVLPDTAMQTSLSDQALLFEALYRCTSGAGRLVEAYPDLTTDDCQEMLDLLQTNPTRTLLGAGFPDEVPLAHKHGFGGGLDTDERMDVGIVFPPAGRPFLAGLYQWDDVDWIHWLRVWPQQIEFSTTVYNYFTTPPPLPAPPVPK